MRNSENVTGPTNGLVPLIAVLALSVATWAGLWGLHKKFFVAPINPISPVQTSTGSH